jgi:hypothetical protein
MKYSFKASNPGHNSTVVTLKDGALLEVRRGTLTGTAIQDRKTWASLMDWYASLNQTGDVYDQLGKIVHYIKKPSPIYKTRDIMMTINTFIESINSEKNGLAKMEIGMKFVEYLSRPETIQFMFDNPRFLNVASNKLFEWKTTPTATPAFIEKVDRLLKVIEKRGTPINTATAENPSVVPMSKSVYCETISAVSKTISNLVAATNPHFKEMLPFYKDELITFLNRDDVVAFLKTDHAERHDIRSFIRFLIRNDRPTDSVTIAANRILGRIPM